jgi:uncharacterized membrane protein YphA (DoxX/SURF4 family)
MAVRVILGLFFIMSGVGGIYGGLNNMAGVPEAMLPNTWALWNMGIFQMIKITEIVAGLMLVVGFLPALAAIFVAPICIGVLVVNGMTAPEYLPSGVFVTVLTAYLGYAYWDKYKALFKIK